MNYPYWERIANNAKAQFAGEPQTNKLRVLVPLEWDETAPVLEYLKHLLPEYAITLGFESDLTFYTIYRPLNQRSQFAP